MNTKMKLMLLAVTMAIVAGSASAALLVYEPFDYTATELTGQGGALGTTGTWTSNDASGNISWGLYQEGTLSGGLLYDGVTPATFDGTVANLPTKGGYAGHNNGGYKLNADIGLDPAVTASFQSGTTTWISYVTARAFDRNAEQSNLVIGTIPAPTGSRGDDYGGIGTGGSGFGTGGGPNRDNRTSIYPMFYDAGQYNNVQGPIGSNSYAANSATFVDATGSLNWVASDDDGFGAANIVVVKLEWDADTGGEDIITIAHFLETEEISEAAFDALVATKPNLSTANWVAANKPSLDQSQFDTLTFMGIKFFVDEIRIGTSFDDAVGLGESPMKPSPADRSTVIPANPLTLSWTNLDPNNPADSVYVDVWFGTDPNKLSPSEYSKVPGVSGVADVNSVTVDASAEGTYYWQVDSYINGAGHINDANMIEGSVWSFLALSNAPPESVVIDTPDMITWSGEGVGPLAVTVDDDGMSALTYAWTADPLPAGVTVGFSDPDVEAPTVTITKVPYLVPFVANGGFEDPPYADGAWGNTTAWTDGGYYLPDRTTWHVEAWGSGAINPSADEQGYDGIAPEGENVAYTSSYAGYVGGLRQILSVNLQADTQYDLSVKVGNPSVYNGGATANYRIQLVAGDNIVAETPSSPSPNGTTDPDWFDVSLSHTSGADDVADPNVGQTLEIRLLAEDFADGYEVDFDDVQLLIDGVAGVDVSDPVSTVTVTVAVNDAGAPETVVTDTMSIDVYDTACLASRIGLGEAANHPSDFSENCITGHEELAEMALIWLTDNSLPAPLAFATPASDVVATSFAPEDNLGILTPGTLAGNNPATGRPWAPGDTYRFAFFTSAKTTAESADISTYNAFVQGLANDSNDFNIGADDGVTWKVIGSTVDVDARDNTSTNPTVDGTGETIFLLDGATVVANDYADLWDHGIQNIINITEKGTVDDHWPWTGSYWDGTKAPGHGGDSYGALGDSSRFGEVGQGQSANATNWVWRTNTAAPIAQELNMYALSDPVEIGGTIDPDAPTVDAGDNRITWSGGPVTLDATVVNNDVSDLTYAWTADAVSEADTNLTINVADADQEDATVTITKTDPTGDVTVVTMTLAGNNAGSGKDDVADIMTIEVYDDACKAAIDEGLATFDRADLTADCITNLKDFAILALDWLSDYAITAPVAK